VLAFAPLRVGVVEGVHYFPQFDADSRIRRDAAPTIGMAMRKLLAKRFDVLLINGLQAQGELRESRYRGMYRQAQVSFEFGEPRRIAISRRSVVAQQLSGVLSRQLAGMVKDGTVRRLLAKADVDMTIRPQP